MANDITGFFEQRRRSTQRIIGLTGGIGMGKTTVSNYVSSRYNVTILDADLFAREVVVPGSEVLNMIVERYGSTMLLPNGQLNRRQLGEIVFNRLPERDWLEQLIHPRVRDRFEQALQSSIVKSQAIIMLVIPLLFEARMTDLVNEIWVVYCSPEQQIERLLQRSIEVEAKLSQTQVQERIKSQMSIEEKIRRSDIVLDNSQSEQNLLLQVDRALRGSLYHSSS